VAPLSKFMKGGVKVGLGTDSVASNNLYDLIAEARFCALLHRAVAGEEFFLSAEDVLRMATLGGAQVLGLHDRIGTLEEGKEADFVVIDFSHLHTQPVHEPVATIVFSCSGDDVIFSAVQGCVLFDRGEIRTLDEAAVRDRLREAVRKIKSSLV